MERFSEGLQYSVFLCDLSETELPRWREAILDVIRLSEDSVVVLIDLGALGTSAPIRTLGTARRLPTHGSTIV